MLSWQDIRPGFYRYSYGSEWWAYRVDKVHGHLDGYPIVDVATLSPSPMGVVVVSVEASRWVPILLHCEPMDPPR